MACTIGAEILCFCGQWETSGNGRWATATFKTCPRAVGGRGGGWVDTRQVSGYLETCDTCGDRCLMDDDGNVRRLLLDSDTIALEA